MSAVHHLAYRREWVLILDIFNAVVELHRPIPCYFTTMLSLDSARAVSS